MSATQTPSNNRQGESGGALLAVLWLSAALAAIALSLATSVRGETERTATAVDSIRTRYLAAGAIERALLYMEWGPARRADGESPYFAWGTQYLAFEFPTGQAEVRIMPEAAKINVNSASPEELFRLLVAVGADPARAHEIAMAIVDWRTPAPGNAPTAFDQYYLSRPSSFQARHASFEEIEELLLVRGMTPELFYGSYERDAEGRMVPRGGLKDCLTVYGAGAFDVNTVEPAVLAAIGLPQETIASIVAARRAAPFRNMEEVRAITGNAPGTHRLRVGGNAIYTLRATARLRLQDGSLSDERRSVAATVKFVGPRFRDRFHVLRWYDNVWVQ